MNKKDLEKLYDVCFDMQDIFGDGVTLNKFKEEIEEMEEKQNFDPLLAFLIDDEERLPEAKKILSHYMKRYQVRIFIHSGDYGFCQVSNENHKTEYYYYNYLKSAKKESLKILKTFKDFKGNCASIYENGKMILTTNNEINYWIECKQEV